jgi:hemerythrin-like metal-binding protein
MDATHRDFVGFLNRLDAAADAESLTRLDEFIAHAEQHFGQEERWMERTAFPPLGCHKAEHGNVLDVMREVRRRVAAGEAHYAHTLTAALAEWFPQHAATMDAMLADFMRNAGFDPGTET